MGKPILEAIIDAGTFNVSVLTRESSKSTFPSSIKVIKADLASVESLTKALNGQDAVVSAVGTEGLLGQKVLIDGAIAAGVKLFIPSEFGSDLGNPKTAALPVFGYKIPVNAHLEEKVKTNPDFSYTQVRNSAFLDWGLEHGFVFDWRNNSPKIFDGGDRPFSLTTLTSVASAVVGVLNHPAETKNRAVYVRDIITTQNKILEIAKKLTPGEKWEPVQVKLSDVEKASYEGLAKGDYSMNTMAGFLFMSILGEGYGGLFEKVDNELLGVPGNKTEADIEVILKPLLAGRK